MGDHVGGTREQAKVMDLHRESNDAQVKGEWGRYAALQAAIKSIETKRK